MSTRVDDLCDPNVSGDCDVNVDRRVIARSHNGDAVYSVGSGDEHAAYRVTWHAGAR